MGQTLGPSTSFDQTPRAQMAGEPPIQRLGTPDDVARDALFLASEEAAWVTVIILDVA